MNRLTRKPMPRGRSLALTSAPQSELRMYTYDRSGDTTERVLRSHSAPVGSIGHAWSENLRRRYERATKLEREWFGVCAVVLVLVIIAFAAMWAHDALWLGVG